MKQSTYHVRQGQEDENETLELVEEESAKEAKVFEDAHNNILGARAGSSLIGDGGDGVGGAVDLTEILNSQCRRGSTVELGNLVEDIYGLLLATHA